MFSSLSFTSCLLWLLSRSLTIHALQGPTYYYISPLCQTNGLFTSANADEALNFTKAAIRRDNANYESVVYNSPGPPADPNQSNIFWLIYSAKITDQAFAEILDDREQMMRYGYEESNDRSTSAIRIECDNDHDLYQTPPGRWRRVMNIPFSPDQDPNRPMQNSQRNPNALAPGTVVEYTDVLNRMRESAGSNFCTSNIRARAVLHNTPERDNQGQAEPRYVITICDSVQYAPTIMASMDTFFLSSIRDEVLSTQSINLFGLFRSLLFLYMLYQLPPVGKQAVVTRGPRQVGLQDLPSIMSVGLEGTRNHAGAFAWYDLLAGFADRGYVFNVTNLRQIQAVKNRPGGWAPSMLDPALRGPLVYDARYVYPPIG